MADFISRDRDFVIETASARGDGAPPPAPSRRRRRSGLWVAGIVAVTIAGAALFWERGQHHPVPPAPPPPQVTVSAPRQQTVAATTSFLGQFSAVDRVELRAQVGGTLTEIDFKDGQIVHLGDLLFVIDPRPYQIRLDQAVAQFQTAQAKVALAQAELWRAQQLKRTEFGTAENVDTRAADERAAEAAVDTAKAAISDAKLDLEFARVTAPFTGRIGNHQVSIGNLISGSRGGSGPTTLLATIVSLDPIYLDFDMSEADYLAFSRERAKQKGALADKVEIELSDESDFGRQGTLDFVDNTLDRSSGTLHARATVANSDLLLTPGEFARMRLVISAPAPTLLIPDTAVLPDQSEHLVMTVAPDGTVAPKQVQIGDLRGGLRVISSGLTPDDRVIIDGLPYARPGAKVAPQDGAIQYAAAGPG